MSEESQTPKQSAEASAADSGAQAAPERTGFAENPIFTPTNLIIGLLVVVIIILALPSGSSDESAPPAAVASAAETATPAAEPAPSTAAPAPAPAPAVSMPAPALSASGTGAEGIERNGEGRLFYTTIKIPANAETLYLSGSGASQKEDGTWGNMEEQAINTFEKFKRTLESQGWSMADIVQVRAFAVAGEYGLLDFDGFNRGYSRFFGTEENPNKPVRSFVQVADLVVDGWLVEIEIRAARVPSDT